MYTREQIADLSWHPLRDQGRSGNYALHTLGYDPKGHVRYLMACGHISVPGHSRCERGCDTAPNYHAPYVYHDDWDVRIKHATKKLEGRRVA